MLCLSKPVTSPWEVPTFILISKPFAWSMFRFLFQLFSRGKKRETRKRWWGPFLASVIWKWIFLKRDGLKGRVRKTKIRTHRDLLSTSTLPRWLWQPGPGQAETRSLEIHLDLPVDGRRFKGLSHHLLLFQMYVSREFDQKWNSCDLNCSPHGMSASIDLYSKVAAKAELPLHLGIV